MVDGIERNSVAMLLERVFTAVNSRKSRCATVQCSAVHEQRCMQRARVGFVVVDGVKDGVGKRRKSIDIFDQLINTFFALSCLQHFDKWQKTNKLLKRNSTTANTQHTVISVQLQIYNLR
jgi:hypothetical protein